MCLDQWKSSSVPLPIYGSHMSMKVIDGAWYIANMESTSFNIKYVYEVLLGGNTADFRFWQDLFTLKKSHRKKDGDILQNFYLGRIG